VSSTSEVPTVELDAHLDQRRAAHGVDPERPGDAPADLVRERLVEQREERFRSDRRQVGDGQEIDLQAEPLAGDAADVLLVGVARIELGQLDHGRDVLGDGGGEAPRHQVPVPLHENEGDHRLQQHHRDDDDQERAGVQPGRHQALDEAAEAVPHVVDALPDRERAARRGSQMRKRGVERRHVDTTRR
jgi:hypothetical protein